MCDVSLKLWSNWVAVLSVETVLFHLSYQSELDRILFKASWICDSIVNVLSLSKSVDFMF